MASDRLPVAEPHTIRRTGSDGVELVADVYRPAVPCTVPTLLMRQPYGRKIASTVVLAHPAWYAARGYVVVIEDVRGRGDSGGTFRVLADDVDDGAAALAWAADLKGTTGQVATYGFSYQAINQFLALAGARRAATKRPDAIVAAMAAWSLRGDWAYEGDAFRLSLNQGWAAQIAAETARRKGDKDTFARLSALASGRSGNTPGTFPPRFLRDVATHYHDWLEDRPETWNAISPASRLSGDPLDVPGLHIGGWLDFMLTGTLESHKRFAAAGNALQRLIVGPWLHLPWSRFVGEDDLGASAVSTIDTEIAGFLDHVLKERGEAGPAVRLFDIGTRHWQDFGTSWMEEPTRWFLGSTGLAATCSTDGTLARNRSPEAVDFLVHDPWRPAPIIGGHLPPSPGFSDRAKVDERADVACYTTETLDRPITLRGEIQADLSIRCDCRSYDVCCSLSILDPPGRNSVTLTSGYRRVAGPAQADRVVVDLRPTFCTVPTGSALRLTVQAAAYPAFAVNPGTGQRPEHAAAADARVTTLAISTGGDAASSLSLPVVQAQSGHSAIT